MRGNSYLPYFLTVVLAMAMRIMPFSPVLEMLNPDWVLLVVLYWTLAFPERFGVFNAWLVGLLVDVLTGRILGQYALVYALICYAAFKFHRRVRHNPIPQQCLFVLACLMFERLIVFWIESENGAGRLPWTFWLPVLTGTLVWPPVYGILRYFRVFRRLF